MLFVGAGGAGKSAVSSYFVERVFFDEYDPTIEDSYNIELNIDGEEYKGELFDTAGLDFGAMRTTYFREGHMFFILFDLSSDRLSPFEYPKQVIEQIRNVKDDEDQEYHFMLVGNKTDLQRKVSAAEAEEFALSEGIPYRETSAKTGEGVDDIIHEMARFMINHEYPQLRRINPVVNVKRAQ
eukprot:CAMPEP_0201511806 /NCGR_PEP_ID=MMETSP0161_2-20130828/4197_1 /ASSEMBLY_ACC=CAM_ASM_000251 /TAXON_ID=180227 /ORGANISM="Neoparamoeba aestuarina, Strain SoJaBio B1-5/56/2" /LENGTH=181 /DNA_ID=CAMNT_0047907435 /DNA_START=147 /DNA_END=692 /DNA_ORIENTATION=+